MYVTNVEKVREYKIYEKGVHKVEVQYLLHKGVGAKRLQLRLFTIGIGGYTPLEKHAHEHEVFVIQGKALVQGGDQEAVVKLEASSLFPLSKNISSRTSAMNQLNSCARKKLSRRRLFEVFRFPFRIARALSQGRNSHAPSDGLNCQSL